MPFSCKLLIVLQIVLGLGAIFGGGALLIDSSGEMIGMPLSMLEGSPFGSFLIPGIILLVVLGILPLIVAYGLMKKRQWQAAETLNLFPDRTWAWAYSLYIGFMLIIWITVQVYIIKGMAVIHLFYISLGLLIQANTLLPSVQKYYSAD